MKLFLLFTLLLQSAPVQTVQTVTITWPALGPVNLYRQTGSCLSAESLIAVTSGPYADTAPQGVYCYHIVTASGLRSKHAVAVAASAPVLIMLSEASPGQ